LYEARKTMAAGVGRKLGIIPAVQDN